MLVLVRSIGHCLLNRVNILWKRLLVIKRLFDHLVLLAHIILPLLNILNSISQMASSSKVTMLLRRVLYYICTIISIAILDILLTRRKDALLLIRIFFPHFISHVLLIWLQLLISRVLVQYVKIGLVNKLLIRILILDQLVVLLRVVGSGSILVSLDSSDINLAGLVTWNLLAVFRLKTVEIRRHRLLIWSSLHLHLHGLLQWSLVDGIRIIIRLNSRVLLSRRLE